MNRAALFFDIDGTVLSEITKEIPASTVDALKRAHDAGHFLFINTGRTYCSVPVELKKLPFDGYLCGCGIYFTFDEEVIFEKHLDPERGDEIADYMTKCQIDGIFEGAEDVYFTSRVSRFDRLENTKKHMNNRGLGIERYMEQRRCPYDKIFIYTDEKSDVKAFFEFIKDDMEVIDRGSNTFECILKDYTKGTAIDWVCIWRQQQ
jgi:hydroxymethylpyrimidine pyrophosphatase-like HAD family hydrolase